MSDLIVFKRIDNRDRTKDTTNFHKVIANLLIYTFSVLEFRKLVSIWMLKICD